MGPVQSIKICLRKYATFSGRASRSEFWWFAIFWIFGAVALHNALIPTASTKEQIFGSFFLLVALNVPVLSVAARRAIDAGFDVSWVGWGFGSIIFGKGLIDIETSPANVAGQTWFTPVGLSMEAVGLLALVFVLSRSSKINVNPVRSSYERSIK